MILKRVVHGVDKNPMAVELAKVALWLHTFTVGAPLSFLDHHLRCGDSVVGAWVRPTLEAIKEADGLLSTGQVTRIENVAGMMTEIEQITDNDIAEVEELKEKFAIVTEATAQMDALLQFMTARHLLGELDKKLKHARETADALRRAGAKPAAIAKAEAQQAAFDRMSAFNAILGGSFGDPLAVAAGEISIPVDDAYDPSEGVLIPELGDQDRRRVIASALVDQARTLAARERFLNWEIAFPHIWKDLASAKPAGGFDAVIGNPPYVRQESLGAIKPALKASYATFDGMADLYVYFYEQALRLLKPGGRMSYVVTNKWLKAGYAEELRGLFSDPSKAEVVFIADFGHAKHFFPDADVFPSVLVVRRPAGAPAPAEVEVCVIPRDAVPTKDLDEAVEAATFKLPRAMFTKESWTLEPKPVMDLIEKIRANGVRLVDYAGVSPLYGIKTGLNEAFLISSATRDSLIGRDPACAALIKPYLRGQDIVRWASADTGLYMIVLKSSADHAWPWASALDEASAEATFKATYPSLHEWMKPFEAFRDRGGDLKGLRHREDQGRFWWELRPCAYYDSFAAPKIVYVDIAWSASFLVDLTGRFLNNTSYFLPTADPWLGMTMNAPVGWWYSWRKAQHGKDEALRYFTSFVDEFPVPAPTGEPLDDDVRRLTKHVVRISTAQREITDWLALEFGLRKLSRGLERAERLTADEFTLAVRECLPRRRQLSAAEVARLKHEHSETIEPARAAAVEAAALERKFSTLVNAAYGLTPEDVRLMWDTAPPRMPFMPAPVAVSNDAGDSVAP